MKAYKGWAAGLAVLLLAGCGRNDTASFMIDGVDTALTLERYKAHAWSDGWELDFIVRRFPDCQRRHKLKAASDEAFKMELYTPAPNAFIIKQGKRWYVTDLKSCDLQSFKEAPPEPGTPAGFFDEKDGALRFVKAP